MDVRVVGVGMIKFAKPGESENYNVMGAKAARRRSPTPVGLRGDPAGVRRLRLRRLDVRPARGLRARPDRHPGLQRQQQLLDRLDRADARRARRSRAAWPSACSSSASSRWRRARSPRSGPIRANPLDKFANVMNEVQGFTPGAARRADVRRRRPRVPLEVRHQARRRSRRSPRRRASTRRRTRTRCSSEIATRSRRSWRRPRSSIR